MSIFLSNDSSIKKHHFKPLGYLNRPLRDLEPDLFWGAMVALVSEKKQQQHQENGFLLIKYNPLVPEHSLREDITHPALVFFTRLAL